MPIRPRIFSTPIVKEFTDREEPRKDFWNRYAEMVNKRSSKIISFFGTGGVGKTALLKKLQEDSLGKNFKYIKYDFSIGTDLRDVLRTFKFQLSHYGCGFPLFDIGDYYYSLTMGQEISAPRQPTMFEQLPWVQAVKKKLASMSYTAGNAMTVFNATKNVFRATVGLKEESWFEQFLKLTIGGLGTTVPLMRTVTIFMSVADMFLE